MQLNILESRDPDQARFFVAFVYYPAVFIDIKV